MSKIIEYTLVSADGVFENPQDLGFMDFRDDAYMRDGLGLLLASDAMLMGRTSYEAFAKIWPSRSEHPWAERLNAIPKYVFSSSLDLAEWANTTIVRGDVVEQAARLKRGHPRNLLIWGHTRLAETLMANRLIDVLDLSMHPVIVGAGKLLFRDGQRVNLRLASTKSFSNIVKLTYECDYS
jgi:dihydrofolate reductase